MSYRNTEESTEICGVPTHTRIHILNGTSLELVVECNYRVPAVPPQAEDTFTPIHLSAEGYGQPIVAFSPVIPGLTGVAAINAADDHVVNIVFTAECASAIEVDVETDVSILVTRGEGPMERTDCILRGTVEIEDAPLPLPV